jgi:hypothetical protein
MTLRKSQLIGEFNFCWRHSAQAGAQVLFIIIIIIIKY